MPSYQYLRDGKPTPEKKEPEKEYTKKEKMMNWLHYHWWYIVAVLVFAAIVVYFLATTVFATKPDYVLGIVTPDTLPNELVFKLNEELTPYYDDKNGDGKVVLLVETYTVTMGTETVENSSSINSINLDAEQEMYAQMAGVTKLSASLSGIDDFIFLVSDKQAQEYQQAYYLIGDMQGNVLDDSTAIEEYSFAFSECPVLTSLDLSYETYDGIADGQEFLAEYRIAMRPYIGTSVGKKEKAQENWQNAYEIYEKLTEGAVKKN